MGATVDYTKYKGMARPVSVLGHDWDFYRSTTILVPEGTSAVDLVKLDKAILDLPMLLERCEALKAALEALSALAQSYATHLPDAQQNDAFDAIDGCIVA